MTLSPVPSGQRLVGGADGDLLIGGTLVEVKTVAGLHRIRNLELWQLALYVVLDDGRLGIDQVALYLGRHARLATWSINEYLTALARQPVDIDALRQSLRIALTPRSP